MPGPFATGNTVAGERLAARGGMIGGGAMVKGGLAGYGNDHMIFEQVLERMAAIHEAKNADYGNSFELAAQLLQRPVVEVLLSRMTDKLARACNLMQRGVARVPDESLADTLLDLANYAALAVVALQRQKLEE